MKIDYKREEYKQEVKNFYYKHINKIDEPKYPYTRANTYLQLFQILNKRKQEVEEQYKDIFDSERMRKKWLEEIKKINSK